MPALTPPQLNKGASDAWINSVNQWMRSQPWYTQLLTSWGQDPAHPHNLSDTQKVAIMRAAQANGAVIDEGNFTVDSGGNFSNKSGIWKDIAGAGAAVLGLFGVGKATGAFQQNLPTDPTTGTSGTGDGTTPTDTGTIDPNTGLPTFTPSPPDTTGLGPTPAGGGYTGTVPGSLDPTIPTDTGSPTTTPTDTGTPTNTGNFPGTDIPINSPQGTGTTNTGPGPDPTTGQNTPSGGTSIGQQVDAIFKALIPDLVKGGLGLLGTNISSNAITNAANIQAQASTEAAKIQAQTAANALAQAKAIYEQQQANLAPYRALGAGAVGNLAYGLGLPPGSTSTPSSSTTTNPSATGPAGPNSTPLPPGTPDSPAGTSFTYTGATNQGQPVPYPHVTVTASPSGSVVTPAGSTSTTSPGATNAPTSHLALATPPAGYMRVKDPSGTIRLVPASDLTQAIQAGGVQV